MATTKVGIYRSYYGPVPCDPEGKPLPDGEWPKKRSHSWVVRWFGIDANRYSKSFANRKEAERFAEAKQSEVREGKSDPPEDISLRDFSKEHAKLMRGQVAGETLADQLRALKFFNSHVGETTSLRRLQPRQAESFVSARLSSGVKIATVNKDIRTLKRVFALAISPRGYLPSGGNPFASIKQRKQSAKPIRFVTPEEFNAVILVVESLWWKTLLSLAYTTGARLNELINLTWSDVDFEKNRIRIVPKDAHDGLSAWEPKDHEGRVLPVPNSVIDLLASLEHEAAEGCPYVFVVAERWTHIQLARRAGRWKDEQALVNNLNRRLATRRKKSGVAMFTYHDLRRSCVTNWARHLPAHVVQKLAGHSDIKTTQKYYLAVRQDDLELARSVQERFLSPHPTDQKLTNSAQTGPVSAQ